MDFRLSDEQELLRSSVRQYLENECSFEAGRKTVSGTDAFNRDRWRSFADMGWLGITVPEQLGGLGLSVVEEALLLEEFGRALVPEPFIGSAVLATSVLMSAATDAQKAAWLPKLVRGEEVWALAYSERALQGAVDDCSCKAEKSHRGYILNGEKTFVFGAALADRFIVAAHTTDSSKEGNGLTLFLIEPDLPGLRIYGAELIDGGSAGDLVLQDVEVTSEAILGLPGQGRSSLEIAVEKGNAAICADSVGAMQQALDVTAEYVKSRMQFDVPIGSFQAVKHRLADMVMELELARSMLFRALQCIGLEDPEERAAGVSVSKAFISRAARFLCGQAIQLHGGMGMAEEYIIGHFYKRVVALGFLCGSAEYHAERYAGMLRQQNHELLA